MDVFNSIVLFMVFILEMRGDLMITTKEAIEYLSGRYLVVGSKCNPPEDECKKHNEVVDMAIRSLEKQVPERFKRFDGRIFTYIKCRTCGNILNYGQNYCENCGQAIDWGEDDG